MRRSLASRLVALSLVGLLGVLVVVALARSAGPGPSGVPATPGAAAASSPPLASPQPTGTAAMGSTAATPKPSLRPAGSPSCRPTDQDRYVYHPSRLEVLRACVRVSGTVAAVRTEADGDLHILLRLDPAYRSLLRRSNQGEELGDLVVEPVCVHGVTQADAVTLCASDPNPIKRPFPAVGEHIWMEGRYVLDLDHGSWAELHPLYRWGAA